MSHKRPRPTSDSENKPCKRTQPVLAQACTSDGDIRRLLRLLDFTTQNTSADILSQFSAIAEILLHQVHLRVTSAGSQNASTRREVDGTTTDYELLEIEFYLWKAGSHEDPFTHGSEEQQHSGNWYFHRAPTRTAGPPQQKTATAAGGYRGGTRKGLDLTFGAPIAPTTVASRYFPTLPSNTAEKNASTPRVPAVDIIRGGILLRTMRNISSRKTISGPSLLVDEILRVSESPTVAILVNDKWAGETTATAWSSQSPTRTSLRLVPNRHDPSSGSPTGTSSTSQPRIYSSPRIGLDLSHSSIPLPTTTSTDTDTEQQILLRHPRVCFIGRPYRYFVHPELLLIANGRGHTFLGVYRSLSTTATYGTRSEEEEVHIHSQLVKLTALKLPAVEKYLREYLTGLREGSVEAFVGPKGKGAGSAPKTALRMFGALCGSQD
ncbi:hypothetical protein BC835DRAFT_1386837 [Cytidiella melzeri]|nr:hypothetical protein BC835DRAFT_1386837 [Cytidiella melzeri]